MASNESNTTDAVKSDHATQDNNVIVWVAVVGLAALAVGFLAYKYWPTGGNDRNGDQQMSNESTRPLMSGKNDDEDFDPLVGPNDVFDPRMVMSLEETMRSEPMYQKLNQMDNKLRDGLEALKPLQGKNVILLVGPTGSGKSTLANAFINGANSLIYDEEEGFYRAREPLVHEGRTMF